MTTASAYARALFAAKQDKEKDQEKDNQQGEALLKNLRSLLVRRRHQSLLPRIYVEYQKLTLREERLELQRSVTPEAERTRVLLELYRTLIQ